jgi:hypothetical protein
MKKSILFLLVLFSISTNSVKAQNQTNGYGAWITDNAHPELKVRYAIGKSTDGHNILYLQMNSSKHCKFNVTANLCNKDTKDKNGWQSVELFSGKTIAKAFKILNTCTNGFWWWYKNYTTTGVHYDDN